MDLFDITFYVFAILTIGSAFVVVFSRNVVHAAFSLLFTLSGVAGLFVLLHADFIAITQILIYVGGILILILFGVMLTNKVMNVDIRTGTIQTGYATVLVAVVAGSLSGVFYSTWGTVDSQAPTFATTTPAIGEMLMTAYLLPFEIVSVILLVALIGAAMIARRKD